tara:strand:+ start:188 stop:649 length:462 start_codon:yes stop_codon:yes gene_type:complete
MRAVTVFSKQTAKTQSFDVAPGGVADFDSTSIALACKGIPRKYYLCARLYYLSDSTVLDEVERYLWVSAAADGHKYKFIRKGEERLRRLCGLAVAEIADPARWKNNAQRGEWMGVTERSFGKNYSTAYGDCFNRLAAWVGVAEHHIRENTREN